MKLSDIMEDVNLNELDLNAANASTTGDVPHSFASRVKTGITRLNPFTNPNTRGRAQGISQIGKKANELMKKFQIYLGSTQGGKDATLGILTAWMQSQNLPLTGGVEQLINQIKSSAVQPSATPGTPTGTPAAPSTNGKLTPDQIAAAKQKTKSGTARLQNNPNGYKDSRVGIPVQKLTGADAKGNPTFQTVRENAEQDIPLNNNMVGQIISASVAELDRAQGGATNMNPVSSSGNQRNTLGNQGGGRFGAGASTQLTVQSVINFYSKLNANGRKQIKDGISAIDTKTPTVESAPIDENNIEFSRFLKMKL